jgi:3-hydroxyisobutyrate dehydrogenase-like beta-hydroxyacid dehydrogenase
MKMMQKDLRLALEMGAQLSVPLPATALGEQLHATGIGLGFEKSDFGPGL